MKFDKPKVLSKHIPEIISAYPLGGVVECKNLGGIPNNTYKVKTKKKTFVVRIYSIGQSSLDHIKIEIDILKHLTKQKFISQHPIAGKNGEILQYWGKYPLLATEFIPGTMAEAKPITPRLAFNIGKLLNEFRKSMLSYKVKAIPEDEKFFIKGNYVFDSNINKELQKKGWKMDVSEVSKQWKRSTKVLMDNMAKLDVNIIHSDFWPPNIKVKGDEIVGLMDFDDWSYGPTFFDLVVAFIEVPMLGGAEINKQIAVSLFRGYFQTGGKLTSLEKQLFADAIEMYCALFLVYNIVQADEFEEADVYLRRLKIFLDKDADKKFREDIASYMKEASK